MEDNGKDSTSLRKENRDLKRQVNLVMEQMTVLEAKFSNL